MSDALYTIETYGELEPHLRHEWLLTNGSGAFASGTIAGANTRRYHGLLCAAVTPPVGRVMALNRIGEIVKLDGKPELHELSVNVFANGVIHPRGDRYLRHVELGETATWRYEIDGVHIAREVQLCWKKNLTLVRYTVDPSAAGAREVELNLLPFVSLRDFHALRRKDRSPEFQLGSGEREAWVKTGPLRLHLRSDQASFVQEPDWWTGHVYPVETERGQDDVEDLFKPGMFVFRTNRPASVLVWASMEDLPEVDWNAELNRREQDRLAAAASSSRASVQKQPTLTIQRLVHAAGDFIVERKCPDGSPGVTVIAGYPWFADWGRDTFISLPGLMLTTGRFHQAGQVLGVFASYVSQGMIPNRFDDYSNQPHYNTVDASLWFIHACFEYVRASGDSNRFEQELLPACRAIVKGYSEGTRYHIRMDPADGLIAQGDATTQLTWMDAKMGSEVFTPRQGKPVEINALWYHALVLLGMNELAAKVRESFVKAFWTGPFRGLADVIDDSGRRDTSIRPNQIFAVSLPNSPLNEDQQRAIVEVVRRELLAPVGLRTLSPSDPKYRSAYTGPQLDRDRAYHNGTIWPWLIGAFLEAHLKVNHGSPEAIEQAKLWLEPLLEHLAHDGCIGSISEIFEADPPHRPVGAFAQAWSIAEVLRLALRLGI